MTKENKKKWDEFVEKNKGFSFYIPEQFHEKMVEYIERNSKFQEKLNAMAKEELENRVLGNEIFIEMRRYLYEEIGMEEIYRREVGFEEEAMKEGVFILNTWTENK